MEIMKKKWGLKTELDSVKKNFRGKNELFIIQNQEGWLFTLIK